MSKSRQSSRSSGRRTCLPGPPSTATRSQVHLSLIDRSLLTFTDTKKGKGKGKGKRGKKEPGAPKGATNAYMVFSKEQRAKLKDEGKKPSFGEAGKLISERWKALSEDDKKPYQEAAEKDKKRHEKELEEFKKKGGGKAEKPAAAKKSKKESSSEASSSEEEKESSSEEEESESE